jgi:hypothetical protein
MQFIKKQINYGCNHSQQPDFNHCVKEIKSVKEKLITAIPLHLHKLLMKVAYKYLIRDDSTLEELKPQEQESWKKY